MNEYEMMFLDFVRSFPRAEVISSLANIPSKIKNADYFFENREIIAELKVFENDMNEKILNKLNGFMQAGKIKPLQRRRERISLGEIVKENDESVVFELFKDLTSAVEDAFEKGNRQIRETKSYFKLPNALGLLFLCNYKNRALPPNVVASKLQQLVNKKNLLNPGHPRYESVQAVIFITEKHNYIHRGETELPFITIPIEASEQQRVLLRNFSDKFLDVWAKRRGVSAASSDKELSLEEFGKLTFKDID